MFKKIFIMLTCLVMLSCSKGSEKLVKGRVVYNNSPVYDCEISVFLKEEKDKTIPPIKVVATDENGFFTLTLKKGNYYLNARKRLEQNGEVLMLVGDTKKVTVERDTDIGEWQLYSKKDAQIFGKGTGISGIVKGYSDYSKVRIYVYKNTNTNLRGPDYFKESKILQNGAFTIDIPEGSYYIAVRERAKNIAGPLSENDKSAVYQKNPVIVKKGSYTVLEKITLTKVDKERLSGVINKGILNIDGPVISGQIIKSDGRPAKKVYVLAYENQEMIGKPVSVSLPSDNNGNFKLILPDEGKYYIGARSKLGGPVEPGELVGTYTGSYDKAIYLKRGDKLNIKLEVHEVW